MVSAMVAPSLLNGEELITISKKRVHSTESEAPQAVLWQVW